MMAQNSEQLGSGEREEEIKKHDPLTRLRGFRVWPGRARGIEEDCAGLMRSLTKVSKEQAAVGAAWETAAPDELRDLGWVMGVSGGRLEIGVENAGARHKVDRWLRSGGLEMIRELAKVRIRSVVIRIGEKG